jgi:hypothetical protein
MTETKSNLHKVSQKFASEHLLNRVLFETNQEEAKRLAPRVRSIAERISKLEMEYLNANPEKKNEIRKFITDNWFKTEWITINWVDMFNDAESESSELNFIDHILAYLSKMTHAEYIPDSEIPHTVVCPSESGISFLNIVNKKLKD